jgi:hypothetical protein
MRRRAACGAGRLVIAAEARQSGKVGERVKSQQMEQLTWGRGRWHAKVDQACVAKVLLQRKHFVHLTIDLLQVLVVKTVRFAVADPLLLEFPEVIPGEPATPYEAVEILANFGPRLGAANVSVAGRGHLHCRNCSRT